MPHCGRARVGQRWNWPQSLIWSESSALPAKHIAPVIHSSAVLLDRPQPTVTLGHHYCRHRSRKNPNQRRLICLLLVAANQVNMVSGRGITILYEPSPPQKPEVESVSSLFMSHFLRAKLHVNLQF